MFSKNNKMHEYISPGLSTKKVIDQYQKTLGDVDLWHSHYEKMLDNLKKLKDINNKLRRQIRNRIGEGNLDMDDLSFQQLRTLEEDMVSAIAKIRERKFHVIKNRTETCRKKVRSLEQMNGNLLLELEKCVIHPQFVLHDEGGEQESAVALANGASNLYAFCHHHHTTHLNHHLHNHHAPPSEPFKTDDLRLA
ncbi:Floral homeotic protein [Stylosanthes scabra]|uniref:Floral homeotic protein n=1 Tax=Stylosanthes scabra TaxID=79078 RepID=A0ABU6RI32_9FABA|nr:Floral homeotic protein [Stylosanthes scabra]